MSCHKVLIWATIGGAIGFMLDKLQSDKDS